jgi:hypothetical protein
MRKLTMLTVILGALLWSQAAFAYSALEDHPGAGVSVGLGGIALSGGGDTVDGSEFVPTISLTGIAEEVVWQVFYGLGSDSSVFGGSLDWILADNFDECAMCPEDQMWWFGAGLSLISYSDLFVEGTTAGISDTEAGVNLGGGFRWDENWGLDLYLHYFPSNEILGVQGALVYAFD